MRNKRPLAIGFVLLGGCVGSAPALPPDTTSETAIRHTTLADFSESDRSLACDQVAAEYASIIGRMKADNLAIEGNRTRNQVAGYVAALSLVTLPVALATVQNDSERREVISLYARRDILIKLSATKNCSLAP